MSAKLLSVNSTLNINDERNWSNVENKSNIIDLELKSFYANNDSRYISNKPNIFKQYYIGMFLL